MTIVRKCLRKKFRRAEIPAMAVEYLHVSMDIKYVGIIIGLLSPFGLRVKECNKMAIVRRLPQNLPCGRGVAKHFTTS